MQNTLLQELVSKRYAWDTVGFEWTVSQPLPGVSDIASVPNGDFSGDQSVGGTVQSINQNITVHNSWTNENTQSSPDASSFSDVASMVQPPLAWTSATVSSSENTQTPLVPPTAQEYTPTPQTSQVDFWNIPFDASVSQAPFTSPSEATPSIPSVPPENQYQTTTPVEENLYIPQEATPEQTYAPQNSEAQHFSADQYPQPDFTPTQEGVISQETPYQPFEQAIPEYPVPQAETQNLTPSEAYIPQEQYSQPQTTQEITPVSAWVIAPSIAGDMAIQEVPEGNIADTNEKIPETKEEKAALLAAEKEYKEALAFIKDMIAPAYMKIFPDKLKINNVFVKTFFVYAYPNYLEWNWLSPIINWDTKFDMTIYVYPTDNAQIQKYLRKRLTQLRSENSINAQKWLVNDPAITAQIQDVEELRTQLTRGSEKYFHFALYITIYAETEDQLNKIGKDVETILAGRNVLQKQSYLRSEQGFISTGPFAKDELCVYRNISTGGLSTTFPFSSSTLSHDDGILYGVNTHNNSLILFDRFRSENANMCVFAKSGWWKSFAVKLEILRSLMMGIDVVVIDPENEYRALVDTVGGAYLDVSLNSRERINPFDLPLSMKDKDTQPGDLLRDAIVNLLGLMNLMLGKLNGNESSIMEKAIIVTYNLKGITLEDDDITGKEIPTMRDLYSILETMDGAKDLCQRLEKYTTGIFSGVFSELTNISLSEGLQVFSVRDLDDILRPTAMYIILSYIWNRVRSSNKKRLLIIDEAWNVMQHEDSAKFLFGLVKRARKYNLWVTTITQDVEDFLGSGYGKPIVTNSSIQLLLKQSPASIDALQNIFKITDQEKYILLNSSVGQWLFFAGSEHVGIQVIASFYEEQIVSTDPNRK